MINTTREQRVALKRVFDRCPLYTENRGADPLVRKRGWEYTETTQGWMWTHPDRKAMYKEAQDIVDEFHLDKPITYRQFRKSVTPYFGDDNCIMVPWCGMWLGIEKNGYTHS